MSQYILQLHISWLSSLLSCPGASESHSREWVFSKQPPLLICVHIHPISHDIPLFMYSVKFPPSFWQLSGLFEGSQFDNGILLCDGTCLYQFRTGLYFIAINESFGMLTRMISNLNKNLCSKLWNNHTGMYILLIVTVRPGTEWMFENSPTN